MANTFLEVSSIARAAIATLYSNNIMANLVWRDFDPDFDTNLNGYKQGQTINVRQPATFTANEFSRAAGITLQDATEASTPLALDKIADVSFAVTDEELTLSLDGFRERLLAPAMEAIAQKIDQDLIGLFADVVTAGNTVGVADTTPTDPTILVDARKVLQDAKVPAGSRFGVHDTSAAANYIKDPLFHQADQRGDTDGLREASIGRKFGADHFEDQNITDGNSCLFHSHAFALAMRPLANPGRSVESAVESYEGLSLRVTMDYDINKKQKVCSVDALYGVKTLDADKAVVILG